MTAAARTLNFSFSALHARLETLAPHSLLALVMRLGVAAVFFISGRTKVEGVITLTDTTFFLFAEEYRVPLLSPETAAYLATWAEHLFPLLLVLGLFTRFSALALFGMTLVIQLFVIPAGWPAHLMWAGPMLYLISRGPGAWSLDRLTGLERPSGA
ncbi:MAG: putative oxidoreductase [Brevundimonas sp.]|jgi:putative oxidoreductase|uniref:DoxX family protein n=1 Tax=Brevundimonas sp. TaxID=1871086 RepID=UPI0039E4DDAC